MTANFDHGPAFRRLAAIHGWDELDDNGPPIVGPPRTIPPVRRDAATIRRETEKRKALGRILGGHK